MSEFADSFGKLTAETIQQFAALLQLKHSAANNEAEAAFASHPTAMLVAVSSLLVFYVIRIAVLRDPMRRYAAVAQHFSVLSGSAAVFTIAVALFPDRVGPFIYMIFGLLSAGEVLYMFRDKLVAEEEVVEGEASSFQVYTRRARRALAKALGWQPHPILPI